MQRIMGYVDLTVQWIEKLFSHKQYFELAKQYYIFRLYSRSIYTSKRYFASFAVTKSAAVIFE